jgi:hypothetical protein
MFWFPISENIGAGLGTVFLSGIPAELYGTKKHVALVELAQCSTSVT